MVSNLPRQYAELFSGKSLQQSCNMLYDIKVLNTRFAIWWVRDSHAALYGDADGPASSHIFQKDQIVFNNRLTTKVSSR